MDSENNKITKHESPNLVDLIIVLTPLIIVFIAGIVASISLFTNHAEKGLGLFALTVTGYFGVSQPFRRGKRQ